MSINKNGLIQHLLITGKKEEESWDKLANSFEFRSGEDARNHWKWYRNKNKNIIEKKETLINTLEEFEQKINSERGEGTVKWLSSKEVLTEEEIYKECKMNPEKWILTQIWHKKRGNGFVYSADFKLKFTKTQKQENEGIDKILTFLSIFNSKYIPIQKNDVIINENYNDSNVVFISLTDLHLDKATEDNLTIDKKISTFHYILDKLLYRAYKNCLIDEVVYVTGNDIFNNDNIQGSTTHLTPQFNNCSWHQSYEKVFEMQVKAISKLKQFCNKLTVIHCSSNHDRTKGFYLAHALEVYFKSDKSIVFNRSAEETKVYTYGVNFIGIHHGDTTPEKLPLYFASKYGKQWGECKYREVAIGDKHSKKSWQLRIKSTEDDIEGVRIFMTPSLGGFGQWDKQQLYDNTIQSGIIRFYSKETGYKGEMEEKI